MGFRVSLHGSNPEPLMSAMGQKQRLADVGFMSALPPKADIRPGNWDVRFVPKADMEELDCDGRSVHLFNRWHSPSAVDCSRAWRVQPRVEGERLCWRR